MRSRHLVSLISLISLWAQPAPVIRRTPVADCVHPCQWRQGQLLHARDHGPRRGALRLRQRRRPRRLLCRRAEGDQPAVQERSDDRRRRPTTPPVHRCDESRRHRPCAATAWAPRSATTTTTATSIFYVTAFGDNVLYRNDGNGTFADVTEAAGVSDPRGARSAAFLDYDRDGDLDLFVANYVDFTPAGNKPCHDAGRRARLLQPRAPIAPCPIGCTATTAMARFDDVTETAGITRAIGNGLGVAVGDYNGDGWLDLYVANDATPNQLWINRRDGTFEDKGLLSGAALNAAGSPEGSMGIASGDYDARRRRGSVRHQHHRRDVRPLRERRHGELRRSARRRRAGARRRRPIPASAPTGSTTTTTAGSICSSPTARSTSSSRCADNRRRIG